MCAAVEKNVIYRRNDPGTTREEWCNWPDIPFEEVCMVYLSEFQRNYCNLDACLYQCSNIIQLKYKLVIYDV